MTKLQQLNLEDNPYLSGNVPNEMIKLSNLYGLDLHNTDVSGSIEKLCQLNSGLLSSMEHEESMSGFLVDLENVDCSCCN